MFKTAHLVARALVLPAAVLGLGLAAPLAAQAAPAAATCDPIPAPPDPSFHWPGGCFIGPVGGNASADCAGAGQNGVATHQWSDWRCVGELRGSDMYYFLYVR